MISNIKLTTPLATTATTTATIEKEELVMPCGLYEDDNDSLDELLCYLHKQSIYKPKMCDIPVYEEKFNSLYNDYTIKTSKTVLYKDAEELFLNTKELLRNYQFDDYLSFNPPCVNRVKLELSNLGYMNGSKISIKNLKEIMDYFMIEVLKNYFNELCFARCELFITD
jgi:hypothetical protein